VAARRLLLALALLALTVSAAGCSIAYVPGDNSSSASKAAATDTLDLRRQVQVLANRCSDTKIGGVVTNRSTSELKVVVEAQMYTPAGAQKAVHVTVDVPGGRTVTWAAATPKGATAASGCQGYAKTIEIVKK
jgi:hypothetical protein